jgi:hypothetical protein
MLFLMMMRKQNLFLKYHTKYFTVLFADGDIDFDELFELFNDLSASRRSGLLIVRWFCLVSYR